jgi:hypothetical protein
MLRPHCKPKTPHSLQLSGIPLVYVHVVTIALYMFFVTEMIAKLPVVSVGLESEEKELAEKRKLEQIPILISFEFLFYIGWLKAAETMLNPFGEDDDDIDINSMIDSNFLTCYLIVDDMHSQYPELLKDRYWHMLPRSLPGDGGEEGKVPDKKLTDFFNLPDNKRSESKISFIPWRSRKRSSKRSLNSVDSAPPPGPSK